MTSTSNNHQIEPNEVGKEFMRIFIEQRQRTGRTPSFVEIARAMGYKTTSSAQKIYLKLESAGIMKRIRGRHRSYDFAVPKKVLRRWLRD